MCFTKYGHSFDKSYTKEVFDLVTALGSKLPAQIKKNGSGLIPKEIAECKTEDFLALQMTPLQLSKYQ